MKSMNSCFFENHKKLTAEIPGLAAEISGVAAEITGSCF